MKVVVSSIYTCCIHMYLLYANKHTITKEWLFLHTLILNGGKWGSPTAYVRFQIVNHISTTKSTSCHIMLSMSSVYDMKSLVDNYICKVHSYMYI